MHLHDLMEKHNEVPLQDHPYNPRVLLQDLLKEEVVFSRLVKESAAMLDLCPVNANAARVLSDEASVGNRPRLGRFGFTKALNNHLHMPIASIKKQQQQQQQECTTAPRTACHVSKYTMLVTFSGDNLRTLFLNLLSWVTYPEVSQILVLLPPSSNATLHEEAKYGDRLLTWHADATHLVKLEFTSSSWVIDVPIHEEAVVWMNGNSPNKANYRGLEAGLELWKRHSDSVVASKGWKVTKSQPLALAATNTGDTPSWLPFCKHETAESITQSKADIQIADLHYFIVHRNYLCFLSHPVLQSLHRFTASALSPSDERLAISMLLTQLSGQPPRLFPSNVKSEGTTGKRKLLRDNHNYVNKGMAGPAMLSAKASSLMTLFSTRPLLQIQKEMDRSTWSTAISTSVGTEETVDETVVTELLGFFGSIPRGSVNWCSVCPEDEEVPIKLVPWMTETCKAH